MMFGRKKTIAHHASAHGLVPVEGDGPEHEVQGVHVEWMPVDVVQAPGEPYVQFGNHGSKYGLGDDLTKPSRRGYIAVRHSQQVPHLYVEGPVFGALTPGNVASSVIKVLGVIGNDTGQPPAWSFGAFAENSEKIELPRGVGFRALCWTGHGERKKNTERSLGTKVGDQEKLRERALLEAGGALPTPEAIRVLTWLCQSFDVELREGWLVAYSSYGDVTTTEDEVWAWVLSAASRLLDLLRIWGAESSLGSAAAWFTEDWVERPKSLDGSLSFLRR